MDHIVRRRLWGTIDVDTALGRVFFQQTWRYTWRNESSDTPWTYEQQRAFHTLVDRQIWSSWSYRITLGIRGNHPLARRFERSGLSINFDVRWMPTGRSAHWTIDAVKTKRSGARSSVLFQDRTAELFANDTAPRGAQNEGTPAVVRSRFLTMPHEFGHMIGIGDEYRVASANLGDADSIMNIGRYVRPRHMIEILRELGEAFAGCTFTVRNIR